MPSYARLAWRTLSLFAVTALLATNFASPAKAVYTWEILGGQLEVTGFLQSEARLHFEDDLYINQWVQKLQIEATQTWQEVGIIDELAITTVIRPEFDVAYYFKGLTDNHIGRGATGDTWFTEDLTPESSFGDFHGFSEANATGGLNKNVVEGLWNPRELNNFTVNGAGSGLPITIPRDGRSLNCFRCRNIDDSPTAIALNRTGSSGEFYPFRELYVDATIGDLWIRAGKQMIVWGKTDNFRLMDVINPVDFGPHYFYDSFEDIRIPQWILSAQYRPGSVGPFTDTAIQLVWNFDEFRAVGLGNPGGAWAFPFGWTAGAAGMFNTYFSSEPCLGSSTTNGSMTVGSGGAAIPLSCFNADGSRRRGSTNDSGNPYPSGFGVPLGLKEDTRPSWGFDATEIGIRLEGRLGKVRIALTNYWGWGDSPVFAWDTINYLDQAAAFDILTPTDVSGVAGINNDVLWANLAAGPAGGIPMLVGTPQAVLNYAANVDGDPGAVRALATHDAMDFFVSGCDSAPGVPNVNPGGLCNVIGGRTKIVWKKNNTTGLAIDYFEDFTGIVFRIESSFTADELVTNTRKIDFVDESDVIRFSIGMDRPTFIKFLNPNRTFFLSAQIFHTYMMGWEGGPSRGFLQDRHQWIYTFFAQGQYMRDRLTPQGFIVYDQGSNGWIAGTQIQYLFNNNWSAAIGGNFQWSGRRQEKHDNGAFTGFNRPFGGNLGAGGFNAPGCPSCGKPIQRTFFGDAQNGATAFRKNDELFFRIRYQF